MGLTTLRRLLSRDDAAAHAAPDTRDAAATAALADLYSRHGAYVFAASAELVEPRTAARVTRDTFVGWWNDGRSGTGGAEPPREQLVAHARAVAGALRAEDPGLAAVRPPDRVIDLLGSLTEPQAAVLTLVAVGDCTFAEAASLLGKSVPHVRRQTLSGLRALSRRQRQGIA